METALKQVGGSLMAVIPAEFVKKLELTRGQSVQIAVRGRSLVLKPAPIAKRYTLKQILASCDFSLPKTEEELEWENASRVGREIL